MLHGATGIFECDSIALVPYHAGREASVISVSEEFPNYITHFNLPMGIHILYTENERFRSFLRFVKD